MTTALINDKNTGVQDSRHDTFEGNILKNVIREAWKESVPAKEKERDKSKEALFELDEHALNMRRILSSYHYEIAAMPVVASNTSRMSKDERKRYLANLEAIAMGSYHLFGPEFTNAIMVGMPKLAKDHGSASKYTAYLLKRLEVRQNGYKRRISREGRIMQNASAQIVYHGSSIFRFFRRAKIRSLKRVVERRSYRIRKLETSADKYSYLLQKVREKARPTS